MDMVGIVVQLDVYLRGQDWRGSWPGVEVSRSRKRASRRDWWSSWWKL